MAGTQYNQIWFDEDEEDMEPLKRQCAVSTADLVCTVSFFNLPMLYSIYLATHKNTKQAIVQPGSPIYFPYLP